MLDFIFNKQQSLVGIDISSSTVRLLELTQVGDKYNIEAFARVSLPDEAVQGKAFKDEEAIVEAIQQALHLSGTKTRHAAVCVSDSSVISKVIQLEDGLSDEEAEELVVLEADKYIPYAIDDVSIDFDVIGPNIKNPSHVDILVVASRAENVNVRVDLLQRCGLEAKIVDVESFAVQRASALFKNNFVNEGKEKIVSIIDIGEYRTQLTVLDNLDVVFTQEEDFGGRQLTEEVVRHYALSTVEAEKAKVEDTLPEDYREAVLVPYMAMVVLQVKRILQYFYSTTHYSSVDMIVLAGGTAQIEGLATLIEKELDISTIIANPIIDMTVSKKVDIQMVGNDGAALMTVCGLALRKFGTS